MTIAQIMAFLAPFEALLKPELMNLEAQAMVELQSLIDSQVQNADLKLLLVALKGALDEFAKAEIAKIA